MFIANKMKWSRKSAACLFKHDYNDEIYFIFDIIRTLLDIDAWKSITWKSSCPSAEQLWMKLERLFFQNEVFWMLIFKKPTTNARLQGAKMAIWHVRLNVSGFLVEGRIENLDVNTCETIRFLRSILLKQASLPIYN